jgi:hypothetical protein
MHHSCFVLVDQFTTCSLQDSPLILSFVLLYSRKIEIFLENGMIHFPEDGQDVLSGAAFDLYRYGQQKGNGNDDGSLRSIARSTNRDVVPIFTAFRRYFDNDDYYADAMIVRAQWISCLIFAHLHTTI